MIVNPIERFIEIFYERVKVERSTASLELMIPASANGKYWGYIWTFDGVNGRRYFETGHHPDVMTVLSFIEYDAREWLRENDDS